MSHRRFLKSYHKFRRDKVSFDGCQEYKDKPKALLVSELLKQLNDFGIEIEYKKDNIILRMGNGVEENEGVQPTERQHN